MADLPDAAARGDAAAVTRLLAAGADPATRDARGLTALHHAAAVGHPAAGPLAAGLCDVDLLVAVRADPAPAAHLAIATALLDAGAPIDACAGSAAVTPLMCARFVGARALAELLLARGANAEPRDAWGRTADRLAVYATVARLIRACSGLPMIASAHVGQVLAPLTNQITSPVVGFTLTGALPGDALAGWPADEPIVAMAMGEDAISRLLRLTPAAYTAPPASASRAIAAGIASAVGGELHRLASSGGRESYAIARRDGPFAAYVQDDLGSASVMVYGTKPVRVFAGDDTAPVIAQAATAMRGWCTNHATEVSPLQLAVDLVATLSSELGAPFEVAPTSSADAFMLTAPAIPRTFVAIARGGVHARTYAELARARWASVAQVRAQIATEARTRELVPVLYARMHALADALPPPPHGPWFVGEYVSSASLSWGSADGVGHEVARGVVEDEAIRVHAGMTGARADLGWDGELADLAADLPAARAAIEAKVGRLTIDRLVAGRRYKVLEAIGDLRRGDVVTFVGIDDIDNHYGKYDFTAADGTPRAIGGDLNSSSGGPLADCARYLAEV